MGVWFAIGFAVAVFAVIILYSVWENADHDTDETLRLGLELERDRVQRQLDLINADLGEETDELK